MDKDITVKAGLSVAGVVLLAAVLHAAFLGIVFEALHKQSSPIVIPPAMPAPQEDVYSNIGTTPKVNIAARDEKKQQGAQAMPPCITCPQPQQQQIIADRGILRRPLSPVRPSPQPSPAPPPNQPAPNPPASAKPASQYQLAVFVGYDAMSNELLRWFDTHAGLSQLKKKCQFQQYTDKSPMYQQRFASVIPPEAFPAVWFLKPDGGHIHLAAGSTLPRTADELYGDLRQGWNYAMDIPSAQQIPNGYPAEMDSYLSQYENYDPSCPDGKCPLPNQPNLDEQNSRRPLLLPNLRDTVRKRPSDPIEGFVYDLLWGGIGTIVLGGVIALLTVFCIIALALRFRS